MSYIKRESSSSDVKDKALDVMIALIRCGSWSCDLDIPSVITQLRKMASHRVSKPTGNCDLAETKPSKLP